MTSFSRQEKLVLIIVSVVLACFLGFTWWMNLSAKSERKTHEAIFVIHVDGAVRNPGVYRVKEGTRVFEALQEAGGTTQEADLQTLNLAQPVYDGQKIVVPHKMVEEPAQNRFSSNLAQFVPMNTPSSASSHLVNVNTASLEELVALPGIGETIAQRIIEYRTLHGPFRSPQDLLNIKGIGSKKLEQIKDLITF